MKKALTSRVVCDSPHDPSFHYEIIRDGYVVGCMKRRTPPMIQPAAERDLRHGDAWLTHGGPEDKCGHCHLSF